MLQIVWPMSITNSIYMLAIVATCMPIDRAHCTADLVFSAHAHKLPDRDRQMVYAYIAVLGPAKL